MLSWLIFLQSYRQKKKTEAEFIDPSGQFSPIIIDQALEQANAVGKTDCGALGVTGDTDQDGWSLVLKSDA